MMVTTVPAPAGSMDIVDIITNIIVITSSVYHTLTPVAVPNIAAIRKGGNRKGHFRLLFWQ